METPLFEHHCKSCIYLGSFVQEQGIYHDLYFCPPRNRGTGQVVSRWGAHSTETGGYHLSTLRSEGGREMLRVCSPISEALRRAEAKGLAGQ